MADDIDDQQPGQARPNTAPPRRGVDPVAMLGGLIALVLAGYALSDGFGGTMFADPRWLLAGGAVIVGVLMLAGTLRPKRHNRS